MSQSENEEKKPITSYVCGACCNECKQTIVCGECKFLTCLPCAKQYITMRPDEHTTWRLPQCMSCKKPWDDTFIRGKFPKSFVEGELKSFMKAWLLDHEKTFLQDTVAQVEKDAIYDRQYKVVIGLRQELTRLKNQRQDILIQRKEVSYKKKELKTAKAKYKETKTGKDELDSLVEEISNLKLETNKQLAEKLTAVADKMVPIKKKMHEEERKLIDLRATTNANGEPVKTERKTFIKPCPVNDCKGFLSTKYKCGLCETHCCADCFEIIGKCNDENDDSVKLKDLKEKHKCDPANIETAKMIRKECKPCPKCGVQIFRISGCDQMWCTSCHTAFNFVTGKEDTGRVHNPHYMEYLKAHGEAPQRPGVDPCADVIGFEHFNQKCRNARNQYSMDAQGNLYSQIRTARQRIPLNALPKKACEVLESSREALEKLGSFFSSIEQWNNHLAAHFRHQAYDQNLTSEIRKKYVKDEYDEKQWQIQAMRKYKQLTYNNHLADITQTFIQISRDILRELLQQIKIVEIDAKTFNKTYNVLLDFTKVYLVESPNTICENAFAQINAFISYMNAYIKDLAEKNGYSVWFQMFFNSKTGQCNWSTNKQK